MTTIATKHFDRQYQTHVRHIKLMRLQPQNHRGLLACHPSGWRLLYRRIDTLSEIQLTDCFSDLVTSLSWSTVKLDLYGLKFYYAHVLRKHWVASGLMDGFTIDWGKVKCTECENHTLVPHSCGHRHCPHCQHHESRQWLERQMKKQVPAGYFLMTFTLPAGFRALAFAHQREAYELQMRCSWSSKRHSVNAVAQTSGIPKSLVSQSRITPTITRLANSLRIKT